MTRIVLLVHGPHEKGHTMGNNITELVFIIDRSGSMAGMEDDTIGGFNSVLEKNRGTEGTAFVTTVLFDHEQLTLHDRVDIREVEPLTRDDYQVRGCTALLDAVGDTVKHIRRVQHYMPKGHKPDHTIVAIITDGMENASRKYRYPEVKHMIEKAQGKGWEFLFLGANIDAAEAGRIGIRRERAARYVNDKVGAPLAYEAVACASVAFREGGSIDDAWAHKVNEDNARRGR